MSNNLTIGEKSQQLDMFKNFIVVNNDPAILSNIFQLWDLIPKFHVTKRQQTKMFKDGKIEELKYDLYLFGDKYSIEYMPAPINIDGTLKHFFPSTTEEMIEKVMRKIMLDQNMCSHKLKPTETWVQFSYKRVMKELARLGKSRSLDEVKLGINILLGCKLIIRRNGQKINHTGIFKDNMDKGSQEYNTDLTESAIQLPQILSSAINSREYRQSNWLLTNILPTSLSRWFATWLEVFFINAGIGRNGLPVAYSMKYSQIVEYSKLLGANKYDNIKRIGKALEDLVTGKILCPMNKYIISKQLGADGKKIIDIEYKLYGSHGFAKHIIASNKRTSDLELLKLNNELKD